MIYEPREDSHLLQKHVQQQAWGRVLDMGTGSGIQALAAVRNPNVREVVAVDINEEAVAQLLKKIQEEKLRKIQTLQSDLFAHVRGQFNVILFNPPYLPQDKGIEDAAIYGGKKGWEVSERFFAQVSRYLFPDGKILFLFSSLTHKERIEQILQHHLFQFQELGREALPYEELYVYLIEKSSLLQELERKGIQDIRYFTQGKRGMIFLGMLDKTIYIKKYLSSSRQLLPVAIKVAHPSSAVPESIRHEAELLPKLNQRWIGPRFLWSGVVGGKDVGGDVGGKVEERGEVQREGRTEGGKAYLVYEFVEGKLFEEWMKQAGRQALLSVLENILRQCFALDKLQLSKEEMHHPAKHVLIDKNNNPWLIDFERCRESKRPQNVTQVVEYICRLEKALAQQGLQVSVPRLRTAAKTYKEEYTSVAFAALLAVLKEIHRADASGKEKE